MSNDDAKRCLHISNNVIKSHFNNQLAYSGNDHFRAFYRVSVCVCVSLRASFICTVKMSDSLIRLFLHEQRRGAHFDYIAIAREL